MSRLLRFPARPSLPELRATERQLLADLEAIRSEIASAEEPAPWALAPPARRSRRGARP